MKRMQAQQQAERDAEGKKPKMQLPSEYYEHNKWRELKYGKVKK